METIITVIPRLTKDKTDLKFSFSEPSIAAAIEKILVAAFVQKRLPYIQIAAMKSKGGAEITLCTPPERVDESLVRIKTILKTGRPTSGVSITVNDNRRSATNKGQV